ncbi:DUF2786 domain-containing protein, partial [Streptomyces cellulosae]
LPVLASREVAVGERMARLFPETTTTRLRGLRAAPRAGRTCAGCGPVGVDRAVPRAP